MADDSSGRSLFTWRVALGMFPYVWLQCLRHPQLQNFLLPQYCQQLQYRSNTDGNGLGNNAMCEVGNSGLVKTGS
jgi:hypothetical protein